MEEVTYKGGDFLLYKGIILKVLGISSDFYVCVDVETKRSYHIFKDDIDICVDPVAIVRTRRLKGTVV